MHWSALNLEMAICHYCHIPKLHLTTVLVLLRHTSACSKSLKCLPLPPLIATAATPETWRRFLGQQLMLLTEIMVFCVPAFFADNAALINPLGKCNSRGTVRSDILYIHIA